MSIIMGDPYLEALILKKIKNLEEYSLKPNANQFFMDSMNEFLSELTEINNEIYQFKHPEAWLFVEYQMNRISKLDRNACGFKIDINVDLSTGLPSLITVPSQYL